MVVPWVLTIALVAALVVVGLRLRAVQRSRKNDTAAVTRTVIEAHPRPTVAIENGTIVFHNRAFLGLFRLPEATPVDGQPLESFVAASTPIDLLSAHDITPAPEGSTPRILEKSAARPMAIDGRRLDVVTFEDVTDARLATATVEQQDRMVMIGTLAASAMHEIKNPLTSVKLNLEHASDQLIRLARDGTVDRSTLVDLAELMAETNEGARRIELLSEDLSTFAAPQRESLAPTDIAECVRTAVRMMAPKLRGTVRIKTQIEDVALVLASEVRVRQMLINLLSNAAHAVEDKMAGREIAVLCRMAGGATVVEIRDNGAGIPPEHLERIFDPLFTTKALGKGTGLGLYVVSRICKGLDAKIDVESTLGRGTTFRLRFERPVVRSSSGRVVMEPVARSAEAKKILLVDDKLSFLNFLQRDMTEHEVTFAVSGEEAIALLNRKMYDVVFLDLVMPKINGRDVYRAVSLVNPSVIPNIVFMTGLPCQDDLRMWLETIDNRLVTKPFDARSFLRERLH